MKVQPEISRILPDANDGGLADALNLIPPQRWKLRLIIKAEEGDIPEAGVFVRLTPKRETV